MTVSLRLPHFVALCGFAVVVSCVVGCGGSGQAELPVGQVSGTVTFAGEPVTEGFVNLVSAEGGRGYQQALGPEGKFQIEDPVVAGLYAVFITPPEAAPPSVESPSPEVPDPANIPQRYRNQETSDLKASITEGPNDLVLKMTK